MSVISKIINNVWSTTNQFIGTTNSAGKPVVVEDPDLTKDRIWIDDQGHTSSTLQPIFASKNSLLRTQGIGTQGGIQYIASDLFSTSWSGTTSSAMVTTPIFTNRGTIASMTDRHIISTYHKSLNNIEYPARVTWKTAAGNFMTVIPHTVSTVFTMGGSLNLANDSRHRGVRTGDFDTAATVYSTGVVTLSTSSRFPDIFFYEDVSNQRIYGFYEGQRQGNSACHTLTTNAVPYDDYLTTSKPITTNENSELLQFIGVDAGKNTFYARSGVILTLGNFTISRYPSDSTSIVQMYGGNLAFQAGNGAVGRQPSNIRIDSPSRHVFYISDRTDAAANTGYPIRFIFNPSANPGTISASACTMSTAMEMPSYTMISSVPQNGRHRGHQFTKGGTNYITFIPSRHGSGTTNSTGAWSWKTYSIDAADDTILTSHSEYSNSTVSVMDWMPIGEYTDRLVSIRSSTRYLDFWEFNTTIS